MTNLEKIKAAWAMGWSATVKWYNLDYQMITCGYRTYLLQEGADLPTYVFKEDVNGADFEITGYKHAGELAGDEPIPRGQKFKWNDKVYEFDMLEDGFVYFKEGMQSGFHKDEIEPYFDNK